MLTEAVRGCPLSLDAAVQHIESAVAETTEIHSSEGLAVISPSLTGFSTVRAIVNSPPSAGMDVSVEDRMILEGSSSAVLHEENIPEKAKRNRIVVDRAEIVLMIDFFRVLLLFLVIGNIFLAKL